MKVAENRTNPGRSLSPSQLLIQTTTLSSFPITKKEWTSLIYTFPFTINKAFNLLVSFVVAGYKRNKHMKVCSTDLSIYVGQRNLWSANENIAVVVYRNVFLWNLRLVTKRNIICALGTQLKPARMTLYTYFEGYMYVRSVRHNDNEKWFYGKLVRRAYKRMWVSAITHVNIQRLYRVWVSTKVMKYQQAMLGSRGVSRIYSTECLEIVGDFYC